MFFTPSPEGTPGGRPCLLAAAMGTLTALTLGGCGGGGDKIPAASQPLAQACPAYRTANLPHGATITRTELRAAQGLLPEVCIVRGEIVSSPQSTIHWAVELPAGGTWNTKTLTIGGGGFDGFIPTDDPWYQHIVGPSAHTYVKMSSDSGHVAPGFAWGASDVALRNHAFDANHFVLEVGTAIATDFYGKRPARRYHIGHSNGGRSALAATQNYPRDYDGVIAMEPAMSQQAHQINLGPTLLRHVFSKPENWLSPAKIALYAKAEAQACDDLDGLKDGIIGNVAACNYVPTDLLCTGADNDSCLTAGQIESVRLIYAQKDVPVTVSQGARGYPGYGRGGAATSDWEAYVFGPSFAARDSFNYMAAQAAARLVEGNPNADLLAHDPTQYQSQYLRLANMIDANNPDLSAFADNGGKLLVWYGMGDTCVSVYRTADYLDSVRTRLGASKVQGFARMLSSPSIGHNLDGPGTDPVSIDLLAAMDAWVERGTAPDRLVATRYEPANAGTGTRRPVLQRPVCEYPKFPRYDGRGDPAKAESFSCSAA
ncbi:MULTISPECIES: tannase/feruloyl esterase family alpha/beta hydrolase [unclassified Delftia]|uniref:tannase/feruloyl esterase family alpha/beta hydrolase n=1 Tax=unclassified Delftia TaxID=2613839 RepID=UPI0006479BFB|nr:MULTISPECIES: tannase/feruloyl esterase family alpha/beta hydrolase [unclassified Delftia]MDC2862324.1 tannase/feruloyl esterase family alpha/beta hydrolase [Delftia sp. DT-2]